MQGETYEAFRAIDVPQDRARMADARASASSRRDAETDPWFDDRYGAIGRAEAELATLRDGAATRAALIIAQIDVAAVKEK